MVVYNNIHGEFYIMYFVYIITNPRKTTFYTGVTNNLKRRIREHESGRNDPTHFTGRYKCYKLLYYETYDYVNDAIAREKQIKDMSHDKKIELIKKKNPGLKFIIL